MGPVVAILGPTASGKSALALDLAEAMGGEIISADALQVYRGFDIGTAKPTPEERRRVPHHLIDILEPDEAFSAGEFARRAEEAIGAIEARGRRAFVVGGTGLYLRALLEGIGELPITPPDLRSALLEELERDGLPEMYRRLAEIDPLTASRLASRDRQRILRALEVYRATGRPFSAWIAERPFGGRRLDAVKIGLTLPRALLYDRIALRVERMVEQGWLDEVGNLLASGLDSAVPAFQAIGYRQLAEHLRGESSLEAAIEDTIRATRRFAKRQLTWFRREVEVHWLGRDDRLSSVIHLIERRLTHGEGS